MVVDLSVWTHLCFNHPWTGFQLHQPRERGSEREREREGEREGETEREQERESHLAQRGIGQSAVPNGLGSAQSQMGRSHEFSAAKSKLKWSPGWKRWVRVTIWPKPGSLSCPQPGSLKCFLSPGSFGINENFAATIIDSLIQVLVRALNREDDSV